ncbi:hypothetical protein AB0D67_37355 [Streptosporangium sp. NPDC048047]|uniref:hypothetical protein n=1 Tax=Streptosporangium sp. NPDC048047 TaxID=3155748 RepID=UPI00343172A3
MRTLRTLSTLAVGGSLLALSLQAPVTAATAAAAPTSSAASVSASAPIKGGQTTVTTVRGLGGVLLENGLSAYATSPGKTGVRIAGDNLSLSFGFPVTGGRATVDPLAGKVEHRGDLSFVNAKNGKRIKVGDFVIDLAKGKVTGNVNDDPKVRVPVFDLDLSAAKLKAEGSVVRARNIRVKLTGVAAGALNKALKTHLFKAGLRIGTASTTLHL